MTIASGQIIYSSDLEQAEDASSSDVNTVHETGYDEQIDHIVEDLDSNTSAVEAAFPFTPLDDCWLVELGVFKSGGAASHNLTVTIVQADGGDDRFLGSPPEVTLATAGAGDENARTNYETTTGERHKLFKGVRYLLKVSSDNATATDFVQIFALLSSKMRQR